MMGQPEVLRLAPNRRLRFAAVTPNRDQVHHLINPGATDAGVKVHLSWRDPLLQPLRQPPKRKRP